MDGAPLAHLSIPAPDSQNADRLPRALLGGRVAAWEWDLSTDHVFRCAGYGALFGLPSGPPCAFAERVHPDDRERHQGALERTVEAGEPYDVELRFLKTDGTTIWVEDRAELQVAPDGRRILTGITADITARVQAQADVRLSQARLEDFGNIASDWFWETDAELRVTYLNGLTQLLPETVALGRTRWEGMGADPDEEPWASHIRTLRARKDFRDFEFEARTRTGRTIWVSSSGRALFDEAGAFRGYRGVSSNITDRKRATAERERIVEQLHHAQKMETIGQLTGGLAHDFNNLLTVILGNADLLLEETADPRVKDFASMIQSAAERGADLNRKLLTFGRRQSLRPKPVNLDEVIAGITPLLRRTLGEHIEIGTRGSVGRAVALADRTQLESAILNLAVNARDAMPKGGILTIEAGEVAAPSGDLEYVSLTVADTGCGMSPEVQERALEPFFTTKEVGKGTGLGLAMVHGFVEQSGGHVTIRSVEGKGTSVTLFLPAGRIAATASDPAPAPVQAPPAVHGRILVVEDEPDIRRFATSTLLALGFQVSEAPDGETALSLLGGDAGVDLLFTEVVLPGRMSGIELAQRAQAMRPALKVLLVSGSPEDAFRQHGRPRDDIPLLQKPCRRAALADAVARVLNAPAGSGTREWAGLDGSRASG